MESRSRYEDGVSNSKTSGDGISANNMRRQTQGPSYADVVQNVQKEESLYEAEEVRFDVSNCKDRVKHISEGHAKGSFDGSVVKDNIEVLRWDNKGIDDNWLKFYAVGVFKSFSNVSIIMKEIRDRHVKFSAHYLGEKNIISIFHTIKDRDDFISNRPLPKDDVAVDNWKNQEAANIAQSEKPMIAPRISRKVQFKVKGIFSKKLCSRPSVPCAGNVGRTRGGNVVIKLCGNQGLSMGPEVGGNIVVDLGYVQENSLGLGQKEVQSTIGPNPKTYTNTTGVQLMNTIRTSKVSQSSSSDYSVFHISETQSLGNRGEERAEEVVKLRKVLSVKKTVKPRISIKCHSMRTRKDKSMYSSDVGGGVRGSGGSGPNLGTWNLETEVAKVIEKGMSLDYFNKSSVGGRCGEVSSGCERGFTGSWRLSEEVAKIIETGSALGFDFHGKEGQAAVEISMREKKDEARFLDKQ
ncbi:hypothetical protein LWI28_006601 [Acer negundo]|uniref:Uncharacterized protein n=1 Tax=Acer negundo TaxID=4023 RepID=A0AAD5J962_ACENE|nr:hypothetical protein LWI28_006601 [Acer negundo]